MKITDDIQQALIAAAKEHKNMARLATASGIKHSQLSRYSNGESKEIMDSTWVRLYPYIQKHLKQQTSPVPNLLPDERRMLALYRNLPVEIREKALKTLNDTYMAWLESQTL